jgi:endonuclease YncB( thermonuclease family)
MACRFVLLALATLCGSFVPVAAWSHGGGNDRFGCHHDRMADTFHCHSGSLTGRTFQSKQAMLDALQARQGEKATTKEESVSRAPTRMSLTVKILSVTDGDTIKVSVNGKTEKVRLIGIDAPEKGQKPWGTGATQFLQDMVEGREVRLELDVKHRDHRGRLLAYVYLGDRFVNAELVRAGHAVMYTVPPNVAHVDEYQKAQVEAREAGRGVWDATHPLNVTPDCYRKLKRGRNC